MTVSPSKGTAPVALARIRPMLSESNMPKPRPGPIGQDTDRPKGGPRTPEGKARSLANLRPAWPSGRSANPGGQPPRHVERAVRRMATWKVSARTIPTFALFWPSLPWESLAGLTLAEALGFSQIAAGIAGETRAAEFAADRIDGPLVRRVDVTSEGKKLAESGQLPAKLLALIAKAKPEGKS